jgi:hypothetical protein
MAKAKFTVLKKIDVMSLAKIFSLFGVIVGFLAGLGIAFASSMSVPIMGIPLPATVGFAAIIVVPIVYGIMYFISGAITAFLYNIIADKIGGIKLALK